MLTLVERKVLVVLVAVAVPYYLVQELREQQILVQAVVVVVVLVLEVRVVQASS